MKFYFKMKCDDRLLCDDFGPICGPTNNLVIGDNRTSRTFISRNFRINWITSTTHGLNHTNFPTNG